MGHTEASGRFMIQYLKSNNWLDENSTVLFFEQTFINIPVNTFVMLRVSFQFAHGGRVLAKIRVNQETFLYQQQNSSVIVLENFGFSLEV